MPPGPKKRPPVAAPYLRPGQAPVNVAGFLVLLKDAKGNGRILAYDLVFEVYAGQDARLRQNMVAVRKVIYETVKQKPWNFLLSTDAKNALKSEINAALGKMVGQDVIKAVYFSKFLIL